MGGNFLTTHYLILEKLGEGGMGEVYLAEDTELGRKVALKVLSASFTKDEDRVRRFKQEARAASALNHPNIITIYEIGEIGDVHFITTEHIEGETLRDRMALAPLTMREVLEVSIQVASALAAAHTAGIVHRDIKPENIMLRNDGYVKILDFGLAKFAERKTPLTNKAAALTRFDTEPGMVMGTTHYMSPEQARGLKVDGRSDIFSLGIMLYEMLTGTVPFDGPTPSDVMVAILDREPPPVAFSLPEIPAELERILLKMLRKDAAERYQTAQDLMVDLKSLKQRLEFEVELERSISSERGKLRTATPTGEIEKYVTAPHQPVGSLVGRRRQLMAVVCVVLALVGGGAYYALFRKVPSALQSTSGRSLAILPFQNLKPDAETNFLGFSLADAIITRLGYIRDLTVRPSSAVNKYRNQVIDPQVIGKDLSVNTLLTGSFLKEGKDLRITAQLVDVETNAVLWRDTLDIQYEKLTTVQDRVADDIVKGLKMNLSPSEVERLKHDVPDDPLAYEYFLRGRDLLAENKFTLATEMFEKSAERNPRYALTWAYLGRAYNADATRQFGGREFYEKAQTAYDKALSLNPEQTEAREYYAAFLTETNRVEEAIPMVREVLKTYPNQSRAHWELSYAYRYAGMVKESTTEAELALKLDPQTRNAIFNCYLYDGQYEKYLQSMNERQDAAIYVYYRGLAYEYLKDRNRASEAFERAYTLDPTNLFAQVGKSLSLGLAGKYPEGKQLLQVTEKQIDERGVKDGETVYKVAQAYARLGDKSAALRMLRGSIERGFFCYPFFMRDEFLENLRGDPEFKRLMELADKRHQEFKKRFF